MPQIEEDVAKIAAKAAAAKKEQELTAQENVKRLEAQKVVCLLTHPLSVLLVITTSADLALFK